MGETGSVALVSDAGTPGICDPGCVVEKELIQKAMQARENSYSPYSHFRVGAAIRLSDDSTIIGANQENAAFGVTLCAERSAIFAAQAQQPGKAILAIAIAARTENGFTKQPISPCGSCRQVMVEIEKRYQQPLHIVLYGENAIYVIESIKNLMPLSFENLD